MQIGFRALEEKDASNMHEWMTDKDINSVLQIDENNVSLQKCLEFIRNAQNDMKNLHFAVVDKTDNYIGTVSLKNINLTDKNAEFAIALHKCAMGTGAALSAMQYIFKYGFDELKLHKIYLCVREDNIRAIKFYKKCDLREEGVFLNHIVKNGEYKNLLWYAMLREEYAVWKKD